MNNHILAPFTKKFKNKKDIKDFKTQYSNFNIKTEVIFNLLKNHDFLKKDFPNTDPFYLFMLSSSISEEALKQTFGSCDFKFEGNRTYRNWILEYEGLTFICPQKIEVVIPKEKNENFLNTVQNFQSDFIKFCIQFANNNNRYKDEISKVFPTPALITTEYYSKISQKKLT